MSLFIAGRSIPHAGLLSALCRQVLALIDGGPQWLQWAIDAHEHRYHFTDESMLLDGVQQGLHGARLMWLPSVGLQVGPIKLLSLGAEHVDALYRLEHGEHGSLLSDHVARLLATHALVTNAQMQACRPFLASIGAADAPLLQQLDFRDALAVYRLAHEHGASPDAARAEAASFALQQARRPTEFCDYYRFYLQATHAGSSVELRHERAAHTLQTLLPMLLGALDGPQLPQLPSPDEVRNAIGQTLASGRQVGYARISLAAQQCGLALHGQALDHEFIRDAARRHMREAQAFLNDHPVHRGLLGQDGASVDFPIEASSQRALVRVEDNVITLAQYGRLLGYGGNEAEVGYQASQA
ncbi:hypothetical protein [Stenotrophomonas sp.]|uniref:hypothetical protein n=1 Tax=Stenotrophomonas sp. TaxID=69392 RepID=UPI002FC62DB0